MTEEKLGSFIKRNDFMDMMSCDAMVGRMFAYVDVDKSGEVDAAEILNFLRSFPTIVPRMQMLACGNTRALCKTQRRSLCTIPVHTLPSRARCTCCLPHSFLSSPPVSRGDPLHARVVFLCFVSPCLPCCTRRRAQGVPLPTTQLDPPHAHVPGPKRTHVSTQLPPRRTCKLTC